MYALRMLCLLMEILVYSCLVGLSSLWLYLLRSIHALVSQCWNVCNVFYNMMSYALYRVGQNFMPQPAKILICSSTTETFRRSSSNSFGPAVYTETKTCHRLARCWTRNHLGSFTECLSQQCLHWNVSANFTVNSVALVLYTCYIFLRSAVAAKHLFSRLFKIIISKRISLICQPELWRSRVGELRDITSR